MLLQEYWGIKNILLFLTTSDLYYMYNKGVEWKLKKEQKMMGGGWFYPAGRGYPDYLQTFKTYF